MAKVIIKLIRTYQIFSKGILRNAPGMFIFNSSCKFYPSCSDYAIEAFGQYGFLKALNKSGRRLTRCHPWSSPGVDMP